MLPKKSISHTGSILVVIVFLLSFLPFQAVRGGGGTLSVKPVASGTGDCSGWANACTLQTALSIAISGNEIWVMAGTHKPTTGPDRTATFQLKSGVTLYGGFLGTEGNRTDRNPALNITILSGEIGAAGNSDNSYHVVTGVTGATLDGFTIIAGNANSGSSPSDRGGGMYNSSSSPTMANITFSGNSADDGGGMYNDSSSPTLTNVTFSGNSADLGAGMFNYSSNPVLTNVTFSGNNNYGGSGGGMYNDHSNPTITNITFSGNSAPSGDGGGMLNISSSPTLANVTFGGNSAFFGGGMSNHSSSSPMLTNVTFSSNSASYEGGGIYNENSGPILTNVTFSSNSASSGGGMHNDHSSPILTNITFSSNTAPNGGGGGLANMNSSSPILTNVTFSGNSAYNSGGGMSNDHSSPILTNITFSGNSAFGGGGMYNYESSPIIRNSIFWGNTTSGGAQIDNYSNSSPSVSDSIVQGGYTGGTNILTADPFLGTLGNYGGFTQTIPLLAGSSAIDTGNDTTCMAAVGAPAYGAGGLDQRGIARPQGAHCDIGAFEAVQQALVVNTGADTDDGACNPAYCTLREAINNANASNLSTPGVVTTITFNLSSYPATISLGSTLPAVSSNLVIHAPWAPNLKISGSSLYRVLTVNGGASLALSGVTIANGNATSGHGGGINSTGGTLSVTDCEFNSNYASDSGGAIHNGAGSLTVTRTNFIKSLANYGGAIDSGEGSLSISDSTFDSNSANIGGGAINNYHSTSHTVLITDSTFYGNSAVYGGGVRNEAVGTLNITNSTFSENSASNEAGGVNNYQGTTIIANSTFSGNNATSNGGSLSNSAGTLNVTNSTLSSTSSISSANLRNFSGTTTLRNTILASSGGNNCDNTGAGPGTLIADLHDLATDLSCGSSVTQTSLANMELSPLANNGGTTETMALLPGSPAIDAGYNITCAADVGSANYGAGGFDQRGITRPQDGDNNGSAICDIGAYELETYTLTIVSPHGTVTKNPNQGTYFEGDVVQLTPAPNTGWSFANWTGGLTGSANPGSVTIHGNTSVTANYTQNEYTLTITSAHGTVTKSPDQATYHEGDVVQLTPTPDAGWSFANWTGALTGSANPGSVTIHGNTSVTANYTQIEYTLTITSAHGTVTKSPDQATYHEGDVVQLTPTPDAGWSFANWTGGLTGSVNPGSVTIHGNTAVTANFTLNTYWIFLPLVVR